MLADRLRSAARATAHGLAVGMGVDRLAARRRQGGVVVLTSHNFTDDAEVGYFGEQPIAPLGAFFRRLQTSYDVVSLPAAHAILQGFAPQQSRPVAVITVDDGYADNFELLYPVVDHLKLPAAFFVTTSFIDEGAPPWPVEIAAILRASTAPTIDWPTPHPIATPHQKRILNTLLKRRWQHLPAATRRAQLDELRHHAGVSSCPMPRPLTWDQIRQLSRAGHTIGSHTQHHGILTEVDIDEARDELANSKARLEVELGEACDFVAYPNGDSNEVIARLASEVGYVGGFTQTAGVNYPGDAELMRHRINLPPYTNAASLTFRTACAA